MKLIRPLVFLATAVLVVVIIVVTRSQYEDNLHKKHSHNAKHEILHTLNAAFKDHSDASFLTAIISNNHDAVFENNYTKLPLTKYGRSGARFRKLGYTEEILQTLEREARKSGHHELASTINSQKENIIFGKELKK